MTDPDDLEPATSAQFDSVVGRVEAQLARGRPAGAVDPPAPVRPLRPGGRDYGTGIAIGVAAVAVLLQAWLARELAPVGDTFAMFGADSIGPAAGFVVSDRWLYGAPLLLAGLVVLAHLLAGRGRRWPAIVIAFVAISTPAVTLHVARSPFTELGEGIRGE